MEKISSRKNIIKENFLYLQCRKGYDINLRKRSASFRLRNLDNSAVRGMKDDALLWFDYMSTTYTAKGVSCFSISKHWAVESLLVREEKRSHTSLFLADMKCTQTFSHASFIYVNRLSLPEIPLSCHIIDFNDCAI